jgi:mRNA interferase MazF
MKRGEIWVYFDIESSKRRPAVIITDGGTVVDIDVTIAKITHQAPRNEFDVPIEYWEKAGLKQPSVVRCSKLKTLSSIELLYRVGTMEEPDLKEVMDKVRKYVLAGWE